MGIVSLHTNNFRMDFNKENGSLINIYSKISNWNIIKRLELAQSWKIMLPLEEKRNNEAWGNEQQKPECIYDKKSVSFVWRGIKSRYGGEHNIIIKTICEIKNDQAVFRMNIKNNDSCMVENVYYPCVGDLYRPTQCKRLSFQHGAYIGMNEYELYPKFPSGHPTHSVTCPTICPEDLVTPPMNPFGLISDNDGNGLYVGVAERRMEATTWYIECKPGCRDSNDFYVFNEDKIRDKDVYVRFWVGHMPFIAPNTEFDLLPFSMETYKGNWNVGASCYTKVSNEWNTVPKTIPRWARKPHSWLQVQINSPEDELRIRYKDIPKIALECKKDGVDVIQLVGWNKGGQDRGNPSHDIDIRLGTYEELKQAIKEVKKIGVKIILFAKFNWADQSNQDFKEIYEDIAIKDPYYNYYVYKGYQYMTLSQLTNINTRRLVPMCFGSDKYLEICKKEFQKCLDLEPDGILYDESQHHSPTLCCFDTGHDHRYGVSSYTWDEKLIESFRKMIGNKEFLIAGEALYDFQHNYYDLSYARTWGRNHKPMTRYIRPNCNIMTAVMGFNDRGLINQCLLNKYIMSYEPYFFKGMLSDFPDTVYYGKKMDKLRTDLREYFWDGEFTGQINGEVKLLDGRNLDSYTVFKGTNGKYGMIICNYDEENPIIVVPLLHNGQKLNQFRLVDNDEMEMFTTGFIIPSKSAVAVIEKEE